jgi:hypothetical protein
VTLPVDVVNELVTAGDHAMLVVTTLAGGVPAGCLVGFATQASIDPDSPRDTRREATDERRLTPGGDQGSPGGRRRAVSLVERPVWRCIA